MSVELDGYTTTVDDVVAVARDGAAVSITEAANVRMAESRAVVERLAEGEPKYGISTGFGALATVAVPAERRTALQLRSSGPTPQAWGRRWRTRSSGP